MPTMRQYNSFKKERENFSKILPYLSLILQQHYESVVQTENSLFPHNVRITKQGTDALIIYYINTRYSSISKFIDENSDKSDGLFSFRGCRKRIITFYEGWHTSDFFSRFYV